MFKSDGRRIAALCEASSAEKKHRAGRVANLFLESSADMAKHSQLVTFAFNSKRRDNKTIESMPRSMLAFFTKRCLTNKQQYTAVTSLDFEFFMERLHVASLLKIFW